MVDTRSPALRAGLVLLALALAAGSAGVFAPAPAVVPPAAPSPPAELPDSLDFEVRSGGAGAEGVDLIWRGEIGGRVPGRVTVRVEYAGPAGERRMPLWPVNAWVFFSADDLRSSFIAELSGSMNWRTGEMRAIGLVSDGVRTGTPVEQRMRVAQPGLSGRATLRFLPGLALARSPER